MSANDQPAILGTTNLTDARERWKVLCEQAANEQDPAKLLEIVQNINQLLRERAARQMEILTSAKTTRQN
jgi:hypothetical protein